MFNKLAKFTLPLVFGLFALICLPALRAKADAPPQISAVAAVVIDQASGKVLYDKDMNAEHYPASTTKVLTALLTLENMDIDDKITLPEDYVNVGETSIGLKAGAHYTSAYDLAMIARVAMDNPEFRRIVTTDSFTVRKLNGEDNFTVGNRNGLLSQYEYADGIKTGYTRQAGNCIVASATKNDMQLIVVVLNSPNIYEESQALLEWGFDNSQHNLLVSANEVKANVKVLNGGRNQVEVIAEKSLYSVMRTDENINVQESLDLPNSVPAPIHRGEVIGSVTYTDENGYTYSTNLLAAKDVGRYNLRLVVRQSFQSVWQVFVVPFS